MADEPCPLVSDPEPDPTKRLKDSAVVAKALLQVTGENSNRLLILIGATAVAPVKYLFENPGLPAEVRLQLTISLIASVAAVALLAGQRILLEPYLTAYYEETFYREEASRHVLGSDANLSFAKRAARELDTRNRLIPALRFLRPAAFLAWAVAGSALIIAAAAL